MMKEISTGAGLSKVYTNHSVRATAITIWSNAEVPARHIMSISGHANEQSISSYNNRPSVQQLKNCSHVLSNALEGRSSSALVSQRESASAPVSLESSLRVSSTAAQSVSFPNGLFQGCSIGNANVYILPQNNN